MAECAETASASTADCPFSHIFHNTSILVSFLYSCGHLLEEACLCLNSNAKTFSSTEAVNHVCVYLVLCQLGAAHQHVESRTGMLPGSLTVDVRDIYFEERLNTVQDGVPL